MSAFDQTIRLLTPEELVLVRDHVAPWHRCQASRCRETPVYVCEYSYVTGQARRIAKHWRRACEGHGKRFALKHGLTLPEA